MVGVWEIDGGLLGMAVGALLMVGRDDGGSLAFFVGFVVGDSEINDGRCEVVGSSDGHSLG